MVKYRGLIIGSIVNVVFGLITPFVWIFMQDSVKMAKDLKDSATAVFAAAFIPALIFYIVWYMQCVKADATVGKKRPSFVIFFGIGLVIAAAIVLGVGLTVFAKAAMYAVIAVVAVAVGSVVSYLVGKPA